MKIPENLFGLTPAQIALSKSIYDGKILKCLVTPFHSYQQLETMCTYVPNIYLMPEREFSYTRMISFINMVAKGSKHEENLIVTSSMTVIGDMIADCVRILTEDEKIVECPKATFAANIHTIRYEVLENEKFRSRTSIEDEVRSRKSINEVIDILTAKKPSPLSEKQRSDLKVRINMIGEPIISTKLLQMLNDMPSKKEKV